VLRGGVVESQKRIGGVELMGGGAVEPQKNRRTIMLSKIRVSRSFTVYLGLETTKTSLAHHRHLARGDVQETWT
jgi:hypothetical protein